MVILANTPYYKRLTRLIYSYKLQSSVKFLGCVSDAELIELYRTSKILVLPSQDIDNHFEGFGLVHLEAHSHGTPAIGSVHSGNHEVIHHGNDGLVERHQLKSFLCTSVIYALMTVYGLNFLLMHITTRFPAHGNLPSIAFSLVFTS